MTATPPAGGIAMFDTVADLVTTLASGTWRRVDDDPRPVQFWTEDGHLMIVAGVSQDNGQVAVELRRATLAEQQEAAAHAEYMASPNPVVAQVPYMGCTARHYLDGTWDAIDGPGFELSPGFATERELADFILGQWNAANDRCTKASA